jgi:parallel beta-helix repeat protein
MAIIRSVFSSIFEPVFRNVTELSSGSGVINLTESQWEALEEYNLEATYKVAGVGTYEGATLVTPAEWAPAAGDLYVAKTGSDANPGTSAGAPKLTIWSAFNSISQSNTAPITIWVDSGTYDENASGGYFLFTKSFAHMVTVRGKPGTSPIIRNVSGSYVIRPNAAANVRFRNIEIQSLTATTFLFSTGTLANFEMIECVFNDANSRVTGVSLANTTQSNIKIKRCIFQSASSFNTAITTATGTQVIGNDYQQAIANSVTLSGTTKANSNKGPRTIMAVNGRTSVAGSNHTVNANTCLQIIHTSGSVGFETVLNADRNTISSTSGARAFSVIGYTVGGGARNNTITSLGDTGLGWPIDGGTSVCDGHEVTGNTITNNASNGHAILISEGGTNATVTGNTTFANGGGNYGLVAKGTNNTFTGNTFNGGNANGILIKASAGGVFMNNTINSSKTGAIALEFSSGRIASSNNSVRDNVFNISAGSLYNQALAQIGTGNQVNTNTYNLTGSAVWGSMFGSTVSSLADVRSAWAANYDVTNNDSTSATV